MPRKVYKKRSYKKRSAKARRYRKRFYRRRFYKRSTIKKPEIHILTQNIIYGPNDNQNGSFYPLTAIGGTPISGDDPDLMQYQIFSKNIEGRKIRLKYLYIKGYLYTDQNNINGKIYIFRRKKNASNSALSWVDLLNLPLNLATPSSWTTQNINDVLYCYDWKNDLKGQIKHNVKVIYKNYDNNNNYIPFKIRIPLYDCVLSCDSNFNISTSKWEVNTHPSTNGLYISYVSNGNMAQGATHELHLKTKLYYTDY